MEISDVPHVHRSAGDRTPAGILAEDLRECCADGGIGDELWVRNQLVLADDEGGHDVNNIEQWLLPLHEILRGGESAFLASCVGFEWVVVGWSWTFGFVGIW